MNTKIEPYLFFGGRCEEAIAFYEKAIGAKVVMLMRYKDAPEQPPEGTLPPGNADKIMHAAFHLGESLIMASDGCGGADEPKFGGFALSLTAPTEAEAQRVFTALTEGGTVTMPLGQTFWSPCFGIVTDKFGINWMVTIPEVQP
jgi:PhnB protein